MTLQNQMPPRAQETVSLSGLRPPALPADEWIPLDELIQRWATFAHVTTSAVGLAAASAAFAALAAETAARHSTVNACYPSVLSASPPPAALIESMMSGLDEARQCWLEALGHLHRLPNGAQDEEAMLLAASLGAQSLRHSQHLLALSARLCYHLHYCDRHRSAQAEQSSPASAAQGEQP